MDLMSEVREINLVLANSANIFQIKKDINLPQKISELLKNNKINVSLITTNNISAIDNIVKNKPDIILVFENYKNIEQLNDDLGFIEKIKTKVLDTKIAFLSGESTPSDYKIGLIKKGADIWIPYKQINNISDILKKLYKGEKNIYEGVMTKDNLSE